MQEYIDKYYQAETWHERAMIMLTYHTIMMGVFESKGARWTIRMTAKKFDRSSGYVSEDLRLAENMQSHPGLKQCPSRDEALRMMRDVI